jgi:predicted nucleic acid-binding protein
LIVDTGVLVAAADRSDRFHTECVTVVTDDPCPIVTTAMVVAEAAYLFRRQLGSRAEASLYTPITDGDLRVETLATEDWVRVRTLVERYADLPLGGTDASLVVIAERLQVERVATLDDHFRVLRPAHCDAFEVLRRE